MSDRTLGGPGLLGRLTVATAIITLATVLQGALPAPAETAAGFSLSIGAAIGVFWRLGWVGLAPVCIATLLSAALQTDGALSIQALAVDIGTRALHTAVCGALLRAWVQPDVTSRRDILRFVVIAGIVVGCVGAVLAAVVGRHAAADWTAWTTSVAAYGGGGLMVLPFFVALRRQHDPLSERRAARLGLPGLLVITAAYGSVWLAERQADAQLAATLQVDVQAHRLAIEHAVRIGSDHVRAVAALVVGHGDEEVAPEQFEAHAATLSGAAPLARALEWAPIVTRAERASFEAREQVVITALDPAGRPQPATPRPRHVPVTRVWPRTGNEAALGFDLGSETLRAAALAQAAATGEPTMTAPIDLVQEEAVRPGVLLIQPVFSDVDAPVSPSGSDARRRRLRGFAVGVFVVDELLSRTLPEARAPDLWVGVSDEAGTTLYEEPALTTARHHVGDQVNVAGRRWLLTLGAGQAYLAAHRPAYGPLVFIGNGLVVLLALLFLLLASGDLHATERTLAARVRELERSNSDLDQFVRVVSHDLQEPLRKLQTLVDVAEHRMRPKVEHEVGDVLDRIRRVAGRTQDLAQSVLAWARAGRDARPLTVVDTQAVLSEVIDDLAPVIADAGAQVEVGPLSPVLCRPDDLRCVLRIVVENAVVFRRPDVANRVTIASRREKGWVWIDVVDNGVGFETDELPRLFEPFERLQPRDTYLGSGLGLPTAVRIMSACGGHIEARATAGTGATFSLRLQAATPPAPTGKR